MSSTPTEQDVLLAILVMDAYSRGEIPKLLANQVAALPTTIGNANWIAHSDSMEGATAIGFSASKYDLGGTHEVISYRGTDLDFSSFSGLWNFINDVLNGWLSSAGITGSVAGVGLAKFQPWYAAEFYKNITQLSLLPPPGEIASQGNLGTGETKDSHPFSDVLDVFAGFGFASSGRESRIIMSCRS
jgi:hypothetical protein